MSPILVSDSERVRTVRMNRPEKRNALTLPMYEAMAVALEEANAREDVRCVLIAGHPSGFSAGSDIGDFAARAESGGLAAPIIRFLHALARSEKPLVAAVAGRAVGIGTTLLLHCDYVVAAEDARLSTPFVSLALTPEAGSSLIAPRLLGAARAFELLVMGRPLDAAAAKQAGIVNAVVPGEKLEEAALAAAREIAALPPLAVKAARALMRPPTDEIVARIDQEAEVFRTRLTSAEAKAAFAAFLNRKT
jgi:enoyl-CoA hydratase/carnithine racemase